MVKINIIEHWTDREKPFNISYRTITQAIRRVLEVYDNQSDGKRNDLLPKIEFVMELKEASDND